MSFKCSVCKEERRQCGFAVLLLFITTWSLLASPSNPLSFNTVLGVLPIRLSPKISPPQVEDSNNCKSVNPTRPPSYPSLKLYLASDKVINGVYMAQNPQTIPPGFVRMCGRVGGFAPRPLWDDVTNGITPWFQSKEGSFIYFNSYESRWWIDDSLGCPRYLAYPDVSLLLPPADGWISPTGRKTGAPRLILV